MTPATLRRPVVRGVVLGQVLPEEFVEQFGAIATFVAGQRIEAGLHFGGDFQRAARFAGHDAASGLDNRTSGFSDRTGDVLERPQGFAYQHAIEQVQSCVAVDQRLPLANGGHGQRDGAPHADEDRAKRQQHGRLVVMREDIAWKWWRTTRMPRP